MVDTTSTEMNCFIFMYHFPSQADVVAQTKISYSEKELLQLIVNHLKTKGMINLKYYNKFINVC